MTHSEADLVRAALAGSEDAARRLVESYRRPLFSLLVRMVHDRALAEDLAQDVFVKAFGALSSFQLDRKFSSWLFKIAHNTAIDHLRRKRLKSVPLETPGEELDPLDRLAAPAAEGPEATAGRGDVRAAFSRCLAALRPSYREVVVLRFEQGRAYDEIAEICDLPMGTVKTHLHRARKQLAECLTAAGFGPAAGAETSPRKGRRAQ